MLHIVLATAESDKFSALAAELKSKARVEIGWAKTRAEIRKIASRATPALIIVDHHLDGIAGLELVRELIAVNAGINFAVVSSLSEKEFHAAGEGLGILARLSPDPDASEAEYLLSRLEKLQIHPA